MPWTLPKFYHAIRAACHCHNYTGQVIRTTLLTLVDVDRITTEDAITRVTTRMSGIHDMVANHTTSGCRWDLT
jgi:hypothetical protein